MGLCLDDHGRISVELRRESFVIHAGYGYQVKNGVEHVVKDPDSMQKGWLEDPHPEFLLEDIDDLILALNEARERLNGRKR